MKLTKLQQLAFGIALIIGVGLFVEFVFLKNDKLSIESVKVKIADLEKEIRVAKKYQESAAQIQEEMEHLKTQLERLKKILPLAINKPKFMADVRRYANENGLEVTRASNNKPLRDDVIVEHPFTYEAHGGFHDFGRFFAQLSNYSQIINVKGLDLKRSKDTNLGSPVVATFIISVFTYQEPTEEELRKQIEEKKKERAGKK